MKSCCKLCGEENCGFVSRNLEYKCDKYHLYSAAVNEACEWLDKHSEAYMKFHIEGDSTIFTYDCAALVEDFCKAMEDDYE